MKVLTRGEDINTLAVVRGEKPLVTQSRTTDGDSLFSGSGRVRASVPVVVTSSNSDVHAGVDGPIDDVVQSLRFTAAQRHVHNGTLVLGLSGGGVLNLGSGELGGSLFDGPDNATDDIRHTAASVGTKDLDGDKVDGLGHTVPA